MPSILLRMCLGIRSFIAYQKNRLGFGLYTEARIWTAVNKYYHGDVASFTTEQYIVERTSLWLEETCTKSTARGHQHDCIQVCRNIASAPARSCKYGGHRPRWQKKLNHILIAQMQPHTKQRTGKRRNQWTKTKKSTSNKQTKSTNSRHTSETPYSSPALSTGRSYIAHHELLTHVLSGTTHGIVQFFSIPQRSTQLSCWQTKRTNEDFETPPLANAISPKSDMKRVAFYPRRMNNSTAWDKVVTDVFSKRVSPRRPACPSCS